MRTARAFALVALALAACASPEERFAQHIRRADEYLSQGRSQEASIELQVALKIDPHSAEANQRLGDLLMESGDARAATFHFGEAYRLDPSRVDAELHRAALTWHDDPETAQRILDALIPLHPNDPSVYRTLSALAIVRVDPLAALDAARVALELDPNGAKSWTQLGMAWIARVQIARRRGDIPDTEWYEQAVAAFDEVDAIENGHVGARLEKARIYAIWEGHDDEAERAFIASIELAQERDHSRHWLAAALAMEQYARTSEKHALRIRALEQAVAAEPTRIRSWERLARVIEEHRGAEESERVYLELIRQHSERPIAHIAYTSHLARKGRTDEAITYIDRSLAEHIDAPALWEQLIRLELSQDSFAEARASFRQMQDRYDDDPLTTRSAARIAIADGRYEEALSILRGPTGTKNLSDVEQLRAVAYLRLNDLSSAISAIERAIALAPVYSVASRRLEASIRHDAQQWARTLQTLRGLEQHGEVLTDAESLMRSRALYERGQPVAGRRVLDGLLAESIVPPDAALEFLRREGEAHPTEAREHLAKAARHAPGHRGLLTALIRAEVEAGRTEQAMRRLDHVIGSSLADPQILLLRAELLAREGDLERAESDALRAFEADPDLPGAVDLLFSLYEAQNEIGEALRAFEEAESVGVLYVGARILLARLYLADGQSEEALEMLEKVLDQSPDNAPAMNDLAYLLATQGKDLDRALTLANRARRALPDRSNPVDTLGYVYFRRGQHERALEKFDHAIELAVSRPGEAPATFHYHRGLTLSALGRNGEAAVAFESALAIDSDFPEAADARRQLEAARREDNTGSS